MRILTRSDVERALSMREAIRIVERAFIELSAGTADIPLRAALPQAAHDGLTLVMPGYLRQTDALAVKIVSIHNRNPQAILPRIHALVIVIDPATGKPVTAMDGGFLTALRTGAASGLATALLARPDAGVAAIFGAGAQARTQLLAVAAVRPIKRCWVYTRHRESVEAFITEMQPHLGSVGLLAAESPSQAVCDADVICTATNSLTPVFDGHDLRPGAHVNGIGSYHRDMQEVDCATLRRASKIVVDQREAALAEAGDLIVAIERREIHASDIYAEIGQIAAGRRAGREREDEITYFKSVGNAAQDAALAHAIYNRAVKENLGVEFDLFV
jgi:ornithine cyclodeaminase